MAQHKTHFRSRSRDSSGFSTFCSSDPASMFRSLSQETRDSLNEPLLSLPRVDSFHGSPSATVSHRVSPSTSTRLSFTSSNGDFPNLPSLVVSPNTTNNNTPLSIPQQVLASIKHNPDAFLIGTALVAWYMVGVLAICTTKLLLSTPFEEGGVPSPLVLTFQQMFLGSQVLRCSLILKGKLTGSGIEPYPVEEDHSPNKSIFSWIQLDYLLLAGLFNGLDFLASATSFSHSSASFVETIKASEPITTTCLAIWWGIDRLGRLETLSLTILITGVLLSTYANATAHEQVASPVDESSSSSSSSSLQESIKTCLMVMTANLCFAFRAMAQKLLRNTATGSSQNLNDFNLLFRMQEIGAASLFLPVLLFQHYTLLGLFTGREWNVFLYYLGLSLVNAWSVATYCLASCFMLSRISVVQHSGFGCLRRLFTIVATSIAFRVPISGLGCLGILMSIVGFSGFTHYRFHRQGMGKKEGGSDNHHCKSLGGDSLTESSTSSEEDIAV